MENNEPQDRLKQILEQREEKINSLSEHLIENDLETIEKELKWLESADKAIDLLAIPQKKKKDHFWPIVIATICIIVIGLGFLPMPSTRVKLEIVGNKLSLYVGEIPESYRDDGTTSAYFDSLQIASFGGVTYLEGNNGDGSELFKIEGNDFGFDLPYFGSNQVLVFEQGLDHQSVEFKNKGYQTYLTVRDAVLQGSELNFDSLIIHNKEGAFYEIIADSINALNEISWSPKQNFELVQIPITDFAFFDSTDIPRISYIKKGKISLIDTDETYDLLPYDELKHDFVGEQKIDRLFFDEEGIHLQMSARVSTLSIGARGFQKQLKPSFFDYLRKSEQYAFVWTALLWLWGMLWSIKRTLFTKPN